MKIMTPGLKPGFLLGESEQELGRAPKVETFLFFGNRGWMRTGFPVRG